MANAAAAGATADAAAPDKEDRLARMFREFGARADAFDATVLVLNADRDELRADNDDLRETVRNLQADNAQRAPAGFAAGHTVAGSVHALENVAVMIARLESHTLTRTYLRTRIALTALRAWKNTRQLSFPSIQHPHGWCFSSRVDRTLNIFSVHLNRGYALRSNN